MSPDDPMLVVGTEVDTSVEVAEDKLGSFDGDFSPYTNQLIKELLLYAQWMIIVGNIHANNPKLALERFQLQTSNAIRNHINSHRTVFD